MTTAASNAACAAACCADERCDRFVTLSDAKGFVGAGVCQGEDECPAGGWCCYLKDASTRSIRSMYPNGTCISGTTTPSVVALGEMVYARAFAPTAGKSLPGDAAAKGAVLLANFDDTKPQSVTFGGLNGAKLWSVVPGKSGEWDTAYAKAVSASDTLQMEPLSVYLAFV